MPGGIEIRGIGKQEAQRVAHAAVAFHHALQDLTGDRQLCREIAARHPQPQDLCAERARDLLRRHRVALRLRHLAAFEVDDEAVRKQSLVGRDAVQHARHQQRRVEPAAVLVRAFEVEVSRKSGLLLVRAAQHGEMRGPRVEPHVERVAAFLVAFGLGTQQRFLLCGLPGFDAAFLHLRRHRLQQLGRARVQLAGLAVQEERHRHAPLPLARQRPVRPVRDHAVQARLPPGREELRVVDAA